MIFLSLITMILQCAVSYANEDQDFFENLEITLSLSVNQDEHRRFKVFVDQLAYWVKDKENLSSDQKRALTNAVFHLIERGEFPNQVQLFEIRSLLQEDINLKLLLQKLHWILNQFQFSSLQNTYSSRFPKNASDSLSDFLSVPEHFRLQSLSKASLKESTVWMSTHFPDLNLLTDTGQSIRLSEPKKHSTGHRYREATFPLEAVLLVIHSGLMQHSISSQTKEQVKSKLAEMGQALYHGSQGYHFLRNLRIAVHLSASPFDDSRLKPSIEWYESLAKAGHPHAVDLMALICACQKDSQGNLSLVKAKSYLEKRSNPRRHSHEFQTSPPVSEFLEYQRLKQELIRMQKNASVRPPADQEAYLLLLQTHFDTISSNPWATSADVRAAADRAFDEKHFKKALYWRENIATGPDATLDDLRSCGETAFYAEEPTKTLYWCELIAKNPNATFIDLKNAALAAYNIGQFSSALLWYEMAAGREDANLSFKREVAEIATHLSYFAKALHWYKIVASSTEATLLDKRRAGESASKTNNYPEALYWFEALANGSNPALEDILDAARTAKLVGDYDKVFFWYEVLAQRQNSTLKDKRRARNFAVTFGSKEKARLWAQAAAEHENASEEDQQIYTRLVSDSSKPHPTE